MPRHQPHARPQWPALSHDHAGSRRRMGRGHRGGHHGLQQPRPRQARAARSRLAAEGADADRGNRAGVLPGVGARATWFETTRFAGLLTMRGNVSLAATWSIVPHGEEARSAVSDQEARLLPRVSYARIG